MFDAADVVSHCRTGTYRAGAGAVVQLLCLGDNLLSLHCTGALRVWKIGVYDAPEVTLPQLQDENDMLLERPTIWLLTSSRP